MMCDDPSTRVRTVHKGVALKKVSVPPAPEEAAMAPLRVMAQIQKGVELKHVPPPPPPFNPAHFVRVQVFSFTSTFEPAITSLIKRPRVSCLCVLSISRRRFTKAWA